MTAPGIIVKALFLGAAFIVLYGVAIVVENLLLSLGGKRAVGKIVHWSKATESVGGMSDGESTVDIYYPTVHFQVDGKRVSFESENGFGDRKWAVGSPVPVLYNKSHPEHAQIIVGRWGKAVALILGGLLFFAVMLFLKMSSTPASQ